MTTRFRLEQRFTAEPDDVAAAFLDPAVLNEMHDLPNVGKPELVGQEDRGDTVVQRVRYRFTGRLAPGAAAVVDPHKLSWVQESTISRATGDAEFSICPDHYADRLTCSGAVTFERLDGGESLRVTTGTLKVRFPLVGGRVERAIVQGLQESAEAEAAVVQRWLDDIG